MNAELDTRTWLTGTASVTASSAVFLGKVRPSGDGIPHLSVWITTIGGWQPQEVMGTASTTYYTRTVQIRIRGNPNDYGTALALAQAIHGKMQRAAIPGYVRVTCPQSAPMYLGQDDQERDELSFWCNLESHG
jgi:hypothetical protein